MSQIHHDAEDAENKMPSKNSQIHSIPTVKSLETHLTGLRLDLSNQIQFSQNQSLSPSSSSRSQITEQQPESVTEQQSEPITEQQPEPITEQQETEIEQQQETSASEEERHIPTGKRSPHHQRHRQEKNQ